MRTSDLPAVRPKYFEDSDRFHVRLREFWYEYKKNRMAVAGLVIVIFFVLIGIFSPWLILHDPNEQDIFNRFQPPVWMEGGSWEHPLGTDELGRDLWSRIIYGSRVSLALGITVAFFATTLGIIMGLVSGYYGGTVDSIIQRIVDILLAFPYLVFAIALMAVLGRGVFNLFLVLLYKEWVTPCRVVRGEVLAARESEYVEAARAVGASDFHIMFKEILPNVFSSVIVVATLRVAWIILMEASLSFIGVGVPLDIPSWGMIIADGRGYITQYWWLSTFPGLAILLTVLGINLMGQGLRDALDPRLKE